MRVDRITHSSEAWRAHIHEEKGRVERSVFSTSASNATGNGKLFNLRLRRTSDSVTPLK